MKKLSLLLLSFLMFSCTESSENLQQPVAIIPELMANGILLGAGSENIPEQNLVIDNQADLNTVITQMNSINVGINFPTVDFSNHKVIAVFDKVQTSGGFNIGIASIIETESQILVTISHISSGETAVLWITQPYILVKIPQTNKPIVFI